MTLIVAAYCSCLCWAMPWRTALAQAVDAVFSVSLLLALSCGAPLLRLEDRRLVVQMACGVALGLCFGFALLVALIAVVCITAVTLLGESASSKFDTVTSELDSSGTAP